MFTPHYNVRFTYAFTYLVIEVRSQIYGKLADNCLFQTCVYFTREESCIDLGHWAKVTIHMADFAKREIVFDKYFLP